VRLVPFRIGTLRKKPFRMAVFGSRGILDPSTIGPQPKGVLAFRIVATGSDRRQATTSEAVFATTDIHSTRVEVQGIGPRVAVAVVELAVGDFTTPTGQEINESRDRLSFTLVNRDERWQIVHGHNTVIDPAAAPYDPIRGEKLREVGAP
jgi:SnoaL-like domain